MVSANVVGSLLRMCLSWLVSDLIRTKFWFHALKRAAEVSNYIPLLVDEKVYNSKPDLRNIFPLFRVAYVCWSRDAKTDRLTFHSTSIRCICIGWDNTSNQLEFYHPPSRQLLYSDDFVLDKHLCTGPTFNLDYDGGLYINNFKDFQDEANILPFHPEHEIFVQTQYSPDEYTKFKILYIPEKYGDIYIVAYQNGEVHQHGDWDLLNYNPSFSTFANNKSDKPLPQWITHECKAAIL